jgi:hypothetical protein
MQSIDMYTRATKISGMIQIEGFKLRSQRGRRRTTRRSSETRVLEVRIHRHDGSKAAKDVAIIKETVVISEYSRITI